MLETRILGLEARAIFVNTFLVETNAHAIYKTDGKYMDNDVD
jgi:hypothetical protein